MIDQLKAAPAGYGNPEAASIWGAAFPIDRNDSELLTFPIERSWAFGVSIAGMAFYRAMVSIAHD
jgi:hypothetical protein